MHNLPKAILAAAALMAPQSATSLDLGISAGLGALGVGASVSTGGGATAAEATVGGRTSPASLAAARLTLGHGAKHDLGAAVEIGLFSPDEAPKPVAVAAPAVEIGNEDRRPPGTAERLLGVVVLSSDRKPLGIVESIVARPDGHHLNVRVLETVDRAAPLVGIALRSLPKRDDAVRLGISYAAFVDRI
jgi:hypothetical protein